MSVAAVAISTFLGSQSISSLTNQGTFLSFFYLENLILLTFIFRNVFKKIDFYFFFISDLVVQEPESAVT
jgi:hypothetical protein